MPRAARFSCNQVRRSGDDVRSSCHNIEIVRNRAGMEEKDSVQINCCPIVIFFLLKFSAYSFRNLEMIGDCPMRIRANVCRVNFKSESKSQIMGNNRISTLKII